MAGEPMLALVGIAGGGVAAQWVAWRLRSAVILVLWWSCLVAGPLTGVLDPDELFGDLLFPAVSLAVGIILFDGSLHLGVPQLRAAGREAVALVTVGASIVFAATTALAAVVLDRPVGDAALLAAVLIVTGPTVIGPLRARSGRGAVSARSCRPRGSSSTPSVRSWPCSCSRWCTWNSRVGR